ncbi:DUF5011 domain-containing protein (plasmid) [Macrococcoides bohemicum]|uniref:immunoglobulin-like domain-containing protein n=1 Tax=Macrococcoides bohemicum TaxID=1903056 RepID=UPI001C603DAA|nr:immunoglobulin-like domain-containing protein [Macrococcus bohemicus]QYA46107.1 DUF5011 domain-containing protein [Macrococcus bohemicus]
MSKKDLNSIYKTQPKKKSLFKKTQLAVAGLMTAVTVISTVHFDTSEYRNGEQNPLSFAKDVSMKVSETINSTVEAAEVGSSVNDADLQLKGFENAEVFDMKKLADPTGQKDSSEVFHNILQKSVDAPIVLNLGDGNYKFDSTHNIEVLGSKGVKIIGNGATIDYLNAKTTNLPEFYAFQFHMKRGDNIGVQIEGVTFDAHRNEQNMFFTFNNEHLDGGYGGDVSSFYKTRLAKGVLISHAEDVSVSNTNFKNAYGGYSLILEGYRHVNYKNINVDNVGGDGQTDSLGMIFYFSGHTFDDAVINMDNMQVEGKVGDKPQSNAGSGFSNPGDESYMSWIGIVVENGTIQSTNKDNWLEDKNTTLNVTNSKFNNFENVYHVESMAGNIAVNMNNIKSRAKQIGISAGIKGKYRAVLNKMDHIQEPWGRNNTYSSLFSSEFGDDPRYHNGYNANLTDANGGEALHQTLMTNSKVTYTERPKSLAGAKGSADVYAGIAYGNMVTANIECSQLDGLWNKAYANGGGYMKDSVVNLWKDNPNDATLAGIKGDPGLNTVNWDNVTVNKAGSWTNVPQTCATPTFNNFSGTESLGGLDSAVTPAPIGGGTTTPPQNLAPIISLSDITIEEGTTFDPLKDVSVTDDHDVNLPLDVKGTVDTSKPGEYTLTYTAKDSGDAVATVTRKVTVTPKATTPTTEAPTTEAPTTEAPTTEAPTTETPKENQLPQIFAYDQYIIEGSDYNPSKNVKAWDLEDGNLTKEVEVVKNEVDTSKPGTYTVTYKVVDKAKGESTATISVLVGKDFSKDIEKINTTLKSLESQLTELNSKYTDLNTKTDANTKEIQSVLEQIKNVKDAINKAQSELKDLTENYPKTKEDVVKLQGQVTDLVSKIGVLQNQITELNAKIKQLEDADKSSDTATNENKAITEELKKSVNDMNELLTKLQDQMNKMSERIGVIGEKLDNHIATDTTPKDDGKTDTTTTEPKDDGKTDTTTTEPKDDGKTDTTTTEPKDDGKTDTTTTEPKDDGKTDTTTTEPKDDGKTDTTINNNVDDIRKPDASSNATTGTTGDNNNNTEIVTSETTKTDDIKKPSNSILPDTGNKSLNYLLYAGVPILLIGAIGYTIYRRKIKEY